MRDELSQRVITLLSDFGLQDTYVGQMKGVILSHCPGAILVDLTHSVPPQDIRAGAVHLGAAWSRFPAGTVHLAVVDPGVGSDRRMIGISYKRHIFIGPDNGIFDAVLGTDVPDVAVELCVSETEMSRTFHGRDVFAPIAGKIAAGATLEEVGLSVPAASLTRCSLPAATVADSSIEGEIILIDHYGNAITNVGASLLGRDRNSFEVACGQYSVSSVSEAYSEVAEGEPVALVSSMDTVELSVRDGSAAARYDLSTGMRVTLRRSH